MQLNAYTVFTRIFLLVILNFVTLSYGYGQNENDIYDLRIHTEVNCGDSILTAALQIKSQQDSFRIGTSSILFNYDENVLEFLDYTSENFDEHDQIDFFGSPASVWDAHKFNSSFAGTCNLTLLAEIAAASFPTVENEWLTIGIARFTIKNINAAPNFTFDVGNTNFNRHAPNDGTQAPTKGVFNNSNELLATQCACEAPTLTNDTLDFDCPMESFEANLTGNDIVSSPTFSIVTDPNSGIASINPNGTLTYTSTTPFCGNDQLIYKVCNDGDANCCSEATVFISFFEGLPPTFIAPPNDITVSCGDVPEMEPIQALDNCSLAEVTLNEVIQDGNCASEKVHVRTWTAIDNCDNQAVHTQMIFVTDNDAPTIACPEEKIINCSDIEGDSIDSGQPTVADNCANLEELVITFEDEVIAEICENNVQRQINRTWTVTDPCGNFATCTQVIKIIDDVAPVITCPADVTLDCVPNISLDSLEQIATAVDNCSSVTVTFEDDKSAPTDCDTADVTIIRTWTATDACGNESSCTQLIIINGNPCPQVVENEIIVYQCENDVVNLPALANLPDNVAVSFADKITQEPISNTAQYLLPVTGCEIGNFEFSYKIYDERECLIENSVLIIKTIPKVIAELRLSSDSCTAELILECPELYKVGWAAGNTIGTGTLFEGAPGESGTVIFTVRFDGLELPEDLELPCLVQRFEMEYSCAEPCPSIIEEELSIVGCQGDFVNLRNRLQIGESGQFESEENLTDIAEYQLVGDTSNCGVSEKELHFTIFNEDNCPIRRVTLTLVVLQPIVGEITHENNFCKAKLNLACADLYTISWKDNIGNAGEGATYEGASGTSGFVTFYVEPTNELFGNQSCVRDSFFADFSCPIECPETTFSDTLIPTCAGETVDLYAFLALPSNLQYTFEYNEPITGSGASIADGQLAIGNPFGCEKGTLTVKTNGFDEKDCLIEVVEVNLLVLPKIDGSIQYENDSSFCNPRLILECGDYYQITWKDNFGNEGFGNVYEGESGIAGLVTFYVQPIDSSLNLAACAVDSFFADFSCVVDCPPSIAADWSINVCGEETIHIPSYFEIDSTARFTVSGIELDENQEVTFSNQSCEIEIKSFEVTVYDTNDCIEISHGVGVTIYPIALGNIDYESEDNFCTPKLALDCPENFQVTWSDDLGNEGEGAKYDAIAGTNGTVTFYVRPIFESLFELACPIDTFYADFACESECPESIERTENITVCANTDIDLFERLDLSLDKTYVFDNAAILDAIFYIGNPFGCEIGTKEYTLEAYDNNECLTEIINLQVMVIPDIFGAVRQLTDGSCEVLLEMECIDNYAVTWEDSEGKTGNGPVYVAAENTVGTVTFYVEYLTDMIILSDVELGCFTQKFESSYGCSEDCPDPELAIIDLYGCEGEEINLFNRLAFSDNLNYRIVENENELDLEKIKLENGTEGCSISQFNISVEVSDESGCVVRVLFISFTVFPNISGQVVSATEDCGLQLDVACAEMYNIRWEDNLGNTGEGINYFGEEGIQGTVIFYVQLKDTTLYDQLENTGCLAEEFLGEFGCCQPAGTACDDGNEETFGDMENGECECVGTPCTLENVGTVIDRTGLDACTLLIEMNDGTILEPAVLPDGVELVAGQSIVFSFVELANGGSICQVGKVVQIICLEANCPEKGTPCTDGDLATINDAADGNCNCIGETVPEIISEIDLRFRPRLDCDSNTYCVMLQAKGQQEDFFIGTSSIMVNYNTDALEFSDYTSSQFDKDTDCTGGNVELWDDHKFDGSSVAGKFCLTMTLNGEGISCPEITTSEWEDIGMLCFDIMDNQASPELVFEANNTHFNGASNNDGSTAITLGQLGKVTMDDALVCDESDIVLPNELALKAMLQGPYVLNEGLMNDPLRRKAFIPAKEPYTGIPSFNHMGDGGGEQMIEGLLDVAGEDAIVDWVFVELRSETDSTMVVATRSALIQRDGDVVDIDGTSNVQLTVPDGKYYVCVKHRNHLGVMTAAPLTFENGTPTVLDFTDPSTPTYGEHALLDYRGTKVLWGGNANPDGYVILAGGGLGLPDRDMIFFDIFLSLWYSNPDAPITYNSVLHGYYGSDTNMDGKVKYQGPENDIDAIIFFNVLFHPGNTQYRLNYAIFEQIP